MANFGGKVSTVIPELFRDKCAAASTTGENFWDRQEIGCTSTQKFPHNFRKSLILVSSFQGPPLG